MTLHTLLVAVLIVWGLLIVASLVLFVVHVGVTVSFNRVFNRALRQRHAARSASPDMKDAL